MYQRAKIYKIESVYNGHEGDIYIGSTCEKYLSTRMTKHRSNYKRWKNGKYCNVSVYKLFDKYGEDELDIVLLEKYPCDSKAELHAREGYHIKSMNCVNKRVAGRTKKEFNMQYRAKNKDKIKQHYQDNKERVSERQKEYRANNDDKIKARKSQMHICICGSTCRRDDKARHERSQKHLKYIADHADTSDSDSESDDE